MIGGEGTNGQVNSGHCQNDILAHLVFECLGRFLARHRCWSIRIEVAGHPGEFGQLRANPWGGIQKNLGFTQGSASDVRLTITSKTANGVVAKKRNTLPVTA